MSNPFLFIYYLRQLKRGDLPTPICTEPVQFAHTGSLTGQGSLWTGATELQAFSPSRARAARYWMDGPDGAVPPSAREVTESLRLGDASLKVNPGSFLLMEQSMPFGMFAVVFKNAGVRAFGVYTDHFDAFVLTNVSDYDSLVESTRRPGKATDRSWIYRFKDYDEGAFTLNTRRLCSRWASWKSSSLSQPHERFTVLESRLFANSPEAE